MNTRFESKFAKDLKEIRDRNLLVRLKQIILNCQQAESLTQISNLKKLQGYDNFYRIRLGDYRVGLEFVENEMILRDFCIEKIFINSFPKHHKNFHNPRQITAIPLRIKF